MSALARGFRAIGTRVEHRWAGVWAARAEILASLVILTGWALVWWGLGDVLSMWLPARGLWAIGGGVFLLSCFGWKMLRTLATHGLYALSQADKK